ncbi:hypothetical protein SAMN05518865_102356 [Duganella sp. CF458]|uniref:hypothetical protein n=1 Tax=Duganella sp. CF458 TaxID=1884368 RepID=UPI0008EB8C9C|nr:hypothetical protein [Duganella sp. CF458]SFF63625.1 hypothetical protein SAMN05518865_102356 [Duganella sp. CF458]
MGDELIQRQVALVSYGTRFLRKELELEDWFHHGIFFGARFQFRDHQTNQLLADDFTQWLGNLAMTGATRLSLHRAADLGLKVADQAKYAIVVHYPGCYQAWAGREEQPVWMDFLLPSAAAYAGDLDCYRGAEQRPGKLDVPGTDWQQLAAAIAADLEIVVPTGDAPLCVQVQLSEEWAKMPLFVGPPLAHKILSTLYREQAKFDNDTHPKNDSSYYHHLDAAGAAAVDHRGECLTSWIAEVHLLCANDVGDAAQEKQPLHRMQEPPPLQSEPELVAPMPLAEVQPPAKSTWINRIALAVAIAVLSLLILALANIIARFPWLAVLVALPWGLYMRQKK